ncbi:ChbG/HpnK family deacetylase [Pseudoduganella ginsengisoli]|uniref:ChbG/HpnK family deacetylase n=1 Tax=Pseudoduganella ginsengisoli TaxID=1462440 RepID=A0A6L6Q6C8_9BURK|nr:ChbG/HpnK family deacetylase [Pseudoduganella ginsengisoli]MTW04831.1 ChbG/HpnK family deacetylase [Pseudoduganella ginsengisoli]
MLGICAMTGQPRNAAPLIINADDVGMHPAIDDAVIELAQRGIVTSASVMSLGRPARAAIEALHSADAGLGLHLDFTSALAHAAYSNAATLPGVMVAAWMRTLKPERVRTIIAAQLDRFCQLTGRPPVFVDGHEHVHQFPMIRDALLDVLAASRYGAGVHIRDTRPQRWRGAKAAIIGLLGARALHRRARIAGHSANRDFLGVYDLSSGADLAVLWRKWLRSVPPQGALAMCHPALPRHSHSLEPFRLREYAWLSSPEFAALLQECRVTPAHWPVWHESM